MLLQLSAKDKKYHAIVKQRQTRDGVCRALQQCLLINGSAACDIYCSSD